MIFQASELDAAESFVVSEIGRLKASLGYLVGQPKVWTSLLRRNAFARNIRGSNAIEGFNITLEDAIAAVVGGDPVDARPDQTSEAWMANVGYRDAMTYVLQKPDDPFFSFSAEILKSLHFIMMRHDLNKNPGRWRPGAIFVRNDATGETVYEGPPVDTVPDLIEELVAGLNESSATPTVVRAAMAHLNLVMIHPFSDGNGRMARALQTLVLCRSGIREPLFASIEEYLGNERNTRSYYDVLISVGQGSWHPDRDTRPWVRFCLRAHYTAAMTLQRRSREMQKMGDELEQVVARAGLPERCVLALIDAADLHSVRNQTYRVAADVSEVVAGRDLRALAEAGLLVPKQRARGRYYVAAQPLLEIRMRAAEPRAIPDPFASPQAQIVFAQPPAATPTKEAKTSSTWPTRRE